MTDRGYLLTEQPNPASDRLDQLSIEGFVDLCHAADHQAVEAVAAERSAICQAIAMVAQQLRQGGRLFYVGAGTSGRLGVLDAAECPPTFCTPPDLVQGVIAGGAAALVRSSESLEDRSEEGRAAMIDRQISDRDVVVGITAGGTTPFVHGALQVAQERGAKTIFLACVSREMVPTSYDLDIRPLVGPEILTGSTRLKAGTATKLVLNTISTGVMVQLGKVYGNRMVDVAVTNNKLYDRAVRMIEDLTDLDRNAAGDLLRESGKNVKLALLMHWKQLDRATAAQLLAENQGYLRQAADRVVTN